MIDSNQPAHLFARLEDTVIFFIDFKITSQMQWHNLIPLIDNALSSEIPKEKEEVCFWLMVKQSIYRWRGGKTEQFIALSKRRKPISKYHSVIFL
jgi:hypothetical protein